MAVLLIFLLLKIIIRSNLTKKIRETENDGSKDLEIMVPLKYLSNFRRTLEMPLIDCEVTLRREIFPWIHFRESFFLTSRVDLISPTGYRLIFREDFFSQILVLSMFYILIFSWFILKLIICELRNFCPNFSIFQTALFGYKRLNSWLFDTL